MVQRTSGMPAMPSTLSRPWPAGETGREGGVGILIAALAFTEVWVLDGVVAIDGVGAVIDGTAVGRGAAEDIGMLAHRGTVVVRHAGGHGRRGGGGHAHHGGGGGGHHGGGHRR
jgi:hypothetical protein